MNLISKIREVRAADRNLAAVDEADWRAGVPAGVETRSFLAANRRVNAALAALPRAIRWIWS